MFIKQLSNRYPIVNSGSAVRAQLPFLCFDFSTFPQADKVKNHTFWNLFTVAPGLFAKHAGKPCTGQGFVV